MMVLIVEDDDYKATAATEFLESYFSDIRVERVRSMKGGVDALATFSPDVVLLDMNLPTYDSAVGEPRPAVESLGGREVLRQLVRRGATARVIVFTQFDLFDVDESPVTRDEMSTQLAKKYACYVGAVHYRISEETWKEELKSMFLSIGSNPIGNDRGGAP